MTIAFDKAVAAALVELAEIANGDLSKPAVAPSPWSVLRTYDSEPGDFVQGFLAKGFLPSAGKYVGVCAAGVSFSRFVAFNTPDTFTLTEVDPSIPVVIPPPSGVDGNQLALGYQIGASALIARLKERLSDLDGLDSLIFTGLQLGAPLALVMALSAQTVPLSRKAAGARTAGCAAADARAAATAMDIACYCFSPPPMANQAMVQSSRSVQPPIFLVDLPDVDFFPSRPGAAAGYYPLGEPKPQTVKVPRYDPPWYERSAMLYRGVLSGDPFLDAPVATGAGVSGAGPGFDAGLALTLSILAADAYRARNHGQAPSRLPSGWTIQATVPDGDGVVRAVIYSNFEWVVLAFSGSVTLDDTVTYLTLVNQITLQFPGGPALPIQPSEAPSALYLQLRPELLKKLGAVGGIGGLKLALTGHDLGGMLAGIGCVDFSVGVDGAPKPSALYTFGSPPVFGLEFQEWGPANLACPWQRLMRPSDVMRDPAYLKWPSLMQYPDSPVTLLGTTNVDGDSHHAISSYVSLLDIQGA